MQSLLGQIELQGDRAALAGRVVVRLCRPESARHSRQLVVSNQGNQVALGCNHAHAIVAAGTGHIPFQHFPSPAKRGVGEAFGKLEQGQPGTGIAHRTQRAEPLAQSLLAALSGMGQ